MALPETVRVKLSSEEAGAISLTGVVVQEMPLRELVEYILGATGKDEARIRAVLRRGSFVSGGSRFRWSGLETDESGLGELLATFPDPDPGRPFVPERCLRAVLRGPRQALAIPREAKGFWSVLMELAAAAELQYAGYSYRDRADRFIWQLPVDAARKLSAASSLVKFSTLRQQVAQASFTSAEFLVER